MAHCYMFKENVGAGCAPAPAQSARTARTTTHIGRYFPAYYLAVGWPSLLTSSVVGIYLVQVASVVVGTAFLALAVASAQRWSSSPVLVPGITVAVTPMALFLTSSVNPSGLEVDSAVATWTAAVILVTEHLRAPPRGLMAVLAISGVAMVWTRPTALAWPLVMAAVLLPAAWGRLRRGAPAGRALLVTCGAVGTAGAGAVLWAVLARSTGLLKNFSVLPASSSYAHIFSFVVGSMPSLLLQGVGDFGWLDTPAPWFTVAAWGALCAGMVVVVVVTGNRRALVSVFLAALASVLVPVALLVAAAHSYGFAGQGRYFLAVWVSVPIVATGMACLDRRSGAARRLATIVAVLVASAQALAFYWALRRYILGIPGPLSWSGNNAAGTAAEWQPPLPGWWLLGTFVAACAVYGFAIAARPGRAGLGGEPLWAGALTPQGVIELEVGQDKGYDDHGADQGRHLTSHVRLADQGAHLADQGAHRRENSDSAHGEDEERDEIPPVHPTHDVGPDI
jgi:hypothetical protein